MDTLMLDVRLAVRALMRRKGYAILAVCTLTVGIGANTAMFSLINGVLLRALPGIERPGELVEMSRRVGGEFMDVSYPVLAAIRERDDILADAAGFTFVPVSVQAGAAPTVRLGLNVTANYFDVIGARPALGRFFEPEDPRLGPAARRVVITHQLWTTHFASAPDILGRVLRVNGVPLEIIGVTASDFRGHTAGIIPDVYLPLGVAVPGMEGTESLRDPRSGSVQAIGRLRPGISPETAAATLSVVAEAIVAPVRTGPAQRPFELRVDPYSPVPAVIRGAVVAFLSVLLAISGVLLALTCANVAALVLARTTERGPEIAVRQSLGASRSRLVRLMLTEALVLFIAAGLLGAWVASVTTPLLLRLRPLLPAGFSVDLDLAADGRVLFYSLAAAAITGIAFTLAPLVRATGRDLASALRVQAGTAGRSRARLRSVLIGVQVAATVLLLVIAGLFVRSLATASTADTGWDAVGVQTTSIDLELIGADAQTSRALFDAMLPRLAALPGIENVALAGKLPFSGRSSLGPARATDAPDASDIPAYFNRVSPGYFATMRIALLGGRDIAPSDGPDAPRVAVINRSMAERLWPGSSAIGRTFTVGAAPSTESFEVVGVAQNATYGRLGESGEAYYFLPVAQRHNAQMILHLRVVPGLEASASEGAKRAIAELVPALPVDAPRPMMDALGVAFFPQRLAAWVSGVVGIFGLLIATVGIYGMISVMIAQRRRELGIRVALGARPGDVVSLLMRQTIAAPVAGALGGSILAIGAGQALGRFLGTVHPLDPIAWLVVALGLAAIIGVATAIPAMRAARTAPAEVLRET